jgi:hypothetical protein
MRTLWQLLILICLTIPIGGALASARLAKVGFGGYALAITIGLALGVCCAWTMWTVGKTVGDHIRRKSESLHERYFRVLYFAAMLWIVFALFLGDWVSSVILRLAF